MEDLYTGCLYDFELDGLGTFFGELVCFGTDIWVLRDVMPDKKYGRLMTRILHHRFQQRHGSSEMLIIPKGTTKNFRWSENA